MNEGLENKVPLVVELFDLSFGEHWASIYSSASAGKWFRFPVMLDGLFYGFTGRMSTSDVERTFWRRFSEMRFVKEGLHSDQHWQW